MMIYTSQPIVSEFWTFTSQVGKSLSKEKKQKTGSRILEGRGKKVCWSPSVRKELNTSSQSFPEDTQAELHQTVAAAQKGLSSKIVILPSLLCCLYSIALSTTSISFSLCLITSSPPKSTKTCNILKCHHLSCQKDELYHLN